MMLQNAQTTASLDISNYLSANKQLLDVIQSGKCILIVGPDLAMQMSSAKESVRSPYLRKLLEGMIDWSIRKKIINDHSIIEDFQRVIHNESWAEAGYKLEEHLAEKVIQQQCLREVVHDLGQVSDIHRLLVRLPFLGYITTTYDTFIETAYFQVLKSRLPKFYQSSLQEVFEAYQNRQRFILKLHGDIDNPASIALGRRFYHGLWNADYQDQLRELLSRGPVLFFGFEEANTDLEVLKELVENGGRTHENRYWIVAKQKQLSEPQADDPWWYKRAAAITSRLSESYAGPASLLSTIAPPEAHSAVNTQNVQVNGSSPRTRQQRKSSLAERNIPISIFVTYARRDAELLQHLGNWLDMLKYQKGLNIEWRSGEITEAWKLGIADPLKAFNIILLLFSPDFCASEYFRSKAIIEAVKNHKNGIWISPVLLRPCLWNEAQFGKLPFLPSNRVSVTMWPNLDAAFQDIASGVEIAVNHFISHPRQ